MCQALPTWGNRDNPGNYRESPEIVVKSKEIGVKSIEIDAWNQQILIGFRQELMGNHWELPEIVGKSTDIDRILAGMDGKSLGITGNCREINRYWQDSGRNWWEITVNYRKWLWEKQKFSGNERKLIEFRQELIGNHWELPEIVVKSIEIDRIQAGMDGKSQGITGNCREINRYWQDSGGNWWEITGKWWEITGKWWEIPFIIWNLSESPQIDGKSTVNNVPKITAALSTEKA